MDLSVSTVDAYLRNFISALIANQTQSLRSNRKMLLQQKTYNVDERERERDGKKRAKRGTWKCKMLAALSVVKRGSKESECR